MHVLEKAEAASLLAWNDPLKQISPKSAFHGYSGNLWEHAIDTMNPLDSGAINFMVNVIVKLGQTTYWKERQLKQQYFLLSCFPGHPNTVLFIFTLLIFSRSPSHTHAHVKT